MTPESPSTVVLVTSSRDEASTTIAKRLVANHGFESTGITLLGNPVYQKDFLLLAKIDTEIISPPPLDDYFNPRAYIFLSRHYAESGIPSLTVHTTGNFTGEEYLGGRPNEVGWVNPDLQKNYMLALQRRKSDLDGYNITVEATHHGPTSLRKPVLFVELGSSEKNWGDEHAGGVIGDALMETLMENKTYEKVAIAFGGTHYPDKVNKMLVETEFAVCTIVAKYYLEGVDEVMFGQIIQKTTRFPRYAAIDWKGMGSHKERIMGLVSRFALEVVKL